MRTKARLAQQKEGKGEEDKKSEEGDDEDGESQQFDDEDMSYSLGSLIGESLDDLLNKEGKKSENLTV